MRRPERPSENLETGPGVGHNSAIRRLVSIGALLAGLVAAQPASAAVTAQPIGTTFSFPMFITSYPDDPDKLLVAERGGTVQLVEGANKTVFLDATSLVGTIESEEGLQSIALAPDFTTSGKLYAYYSGSGVGDHAQLDEFTASGDSVDLSTRRPVLTVNRLADRPRHFGGQLQFGPDGYLYLTVGNSDDSALSQPTNTLNGKHLRIDPNQSGGSPYSIPADNPFVGVAGEDEIWGFGLRNPFRSSFDRVTGALTIADVGRQTREEVNYELQPNAGRGSNYGFRCFEGNEVNNTDPSCQNPAPPLVFPIFDYPHNEMDSCAIIGGYVARDPSLGDTYGRYVFADLCGSLVRSFVPGIPTASGHRSEGALLSQRPVSFGEDSCGRLYAAGLQSTVWRLVGASPADCTPGFVRIIGGVLSINSGTGVANRVAINPSNSGADWIIGDKAAPLSPGPGCSQVDPNRIRCPTSAVDNARIETADLGDRVTTPNGLDVTVEGGAGDDRVNTANGADALNGDLGKDVLDGGAGPDVYDGGPGRDSVSYAPRTAGQPVVVDIDGDADDGGAADEAGGQRDNVLATVEEAVGGAGADSLTGNDLSNTLTGGLGADQLHGLGRNDIVRANGDGSDDTITCGAGSADHVFADLTDIFPVAGPDACEIVN
jgi:glucose/arabinose dehydrogenase